jgi:protein-tyrosine kinase
MKEGLAVSGDYMGQGVGSSNMILPPLDLLPTVPWAVDEAAERGLYGFDSRDIRSRPFNLLRRRLLRQAEARGWKLIGIVSATPGVGKSFVASNLAAALSRTPDVNVCLFDFDLRKSSVGRIFGVEERAGLNQYLSGEVPDLRDVAIRLGDQQLTIVPSTRSGHSSAELLAGDRMKELIHAMRALPANTICICDLPPVFANDDAAIVASKLDAYLLIVEEGRTTKKQIKDSVNLLAPAICGGTVLNHYYGGIISDDYGYGYGHAGKYGDYYG